MTTIFTIGHGNRAIGEFIALLKEAGIQCLVDVRAFPASRRHPQFACAALGQALMDANIHYRWEGNALGGRRRPNKDSLHSALRNASFRAYADHMMTTEFQQALDRLLALASSERVAIMCAERLPWQCHRYLIADSVVARGEKAVHLMDAGKQQEHHLNPVARVGRQGVIYDKNENLVLGIN